MKKSLILFIVFFVSISCNYNSLETPKDNIDVESISQTEAFKNFKVEAERFNSPYIDKLNNSNDEELNELHKMLDKFVAKNNHHNINASREEYTVLVKEMGYSGIENYEKRHQNYMKSLSHFINENPDIKKLSDEDRKDFFIKLFTKPFNVKRKSVDEPTASDCTYDFSYCLQTKKAYYIARSGACAIGLLGGPFGGLAAISCQIANTSVYELDKQQCAINYDNCQDQ